MARKFKQEVKEDGNVQATYKTKIKFKCPTRGWVEQEVEVKKFKTVDAPENQSAITEISELIDAISETESDEEV